MGNTLPVPNTNSPLVDTKTGKIVPPWNSWFQQFSQRAPAVVNIGVASFTANSNGTVIITGVNISLVRGITLIPLGTGQRIIPISIGDTVNCDSASAFQFLGA